MEEGQESALGASGACSSASSARRSAVFSPLDFPAFEGACDNVASILVDGTLDYNTTEHLWAKGMELDEATAQREWLASWQLEEVQMGAIVREQCAESLVEAASVAFTLARDGSRTAGATLGDTSIMRTELRAHLVTLMHYGADEDDEPALCQLRTCTGMSVRAMAGRSLAAQQTMSDGDYHQWVVDQSTPHCWLHGPAVALLAHLFDRDIFLFCASIQRVFIFHARRFADRRSLVAALDQLLTHKSEPMSDALQKLVAALRRFRAPLPRDTASYRQPLMLSYHPRVRYTALKLNEITFDTVMERLCPGGLQSADRGPRVSTPPADHAEALETTTSAPDSDSSSTAPPIVHPIPDTSSLCRTEEGCALLRVLVQLSFWLHDLYDTGGPLALTQNPNSSEFTDIKEGERPELLRNLHKAGQKWLQDAVNDLPREHPMHQLGLDIYLSDSSVSASVQHPFLLAITRDMRPGRVFVVYRSTVSGTCSADVLADLKCWTAGGSGLRPGLKHAGFDARADTLDFLHASILQWLQDGAEVYLTGHSLGGAVAQCVASRVVHQLIERDRTPTSVRLKCVCFGNPPVADPEFWRPYRAWWHVFESYIYRRDVVFRAPLFAPEAAKSALGAALKSLGGALKHVSEVAQKASHLGIAMTSTVVGVAGAVLDEHGVAVADVAATQLVPRFAPFGRHHFLTTGASSGSRVSVEVRSWGVNQEHVEDLFQGQDTSGAYVLERAAWWCSLQAVTQPSTDRATSVQLIDTKIDLQDAYDHAQYPLLMTQLKQHAFPQTSPSLFKRAPDAGHLTDETMLVELEEAKQHAEAIPVETEDTRHMARVVTFKNDSCPYQAQLTSVSGDLTLQISTTFGAAFIRSVTVWIRKDLLCDRRCNDCASCRGEWSVKPTAGLSSNRHLGCEVPIHHPRIQKWLKSLRSDESFRITISSCFHTWHQLEVRSMTSASAGMRTVESLTPIEVVFAIYWEYLLSAGDCHPDRPKLSDPLANLLQALSNMLPNDLDRLLARFLAEFMCHSSEGQTSLMLDNVLLNMPRSVEAQVAHVDGINVKGNPRVNGVRGTDDPETPETLTQAEFIQRHLLAPLTHASCCGITINVSANAGSAPEAPAISASAQISRVLYWRVLNTLRADTRRDRASMAPPATAASGSASSTSVSDSANYRLALYQAVLREAVKLATAAGTADGDSFLLVLLKDFHDDMPPVAQAALDRLLALHPTLPALQGQLPDAYLRQRNELVLLDDALVTIHATFQARAKRLQSAQDNAAVEQALMEALAPLCLVLVKLARTTVTTATLVEKASVFSFRKSERVAASLSQACAGSKLNVPFKLLFGPFRWVFAKGVQWMGGEQAYLQTVSARLSQQLVDSACSILESLEVSPQTFRDDPWSALTKCQSSADFLRFVATSPVRVHSQWASLWKANPLKQVTDGPAQQVWSMIARTIHAVLACRRTLLEQLALHKVPLIGPSQSGKTNCYFSFRNEVYQRGTYYNTVFPSQRLCSVALSAHDPSADILVVDNPGMNEVSHIGHFLMSWALSRAVCVVLIGDFTSINQSAVKHLLEFVTPITTCPILVLCNKIDEEIAKEMNPQTVMRSHGFLAHASTATAHTSTNVPASSQATSSTSSASALVPLDPAQVAPGRSARDILVQRAAHFVYLRLDNVLRACRDSLRSFLEHSRRAHPTSNVDRVFQLQHDERRFVFRGATLQPPTDAMLQEASVVLDHPNPMSVELRRGVMDMADLKRWIKRVRPPS